MLLNRPKSYHLFIVLILALAVGLTGCFSKDYTPVLTSITISPSSASLAIGQSRQFTAVAKDQKGKTMSGITFQWAVEPEEIGEITSDGQFTGKNTGQGKVICTAKDKTAAATVTVNEPPKISLEEIAEQIVDDTRRVEKAIESIIRDRLASMPEPLEEKFLPYLPSVVMAVDYNIFGIISTLDSNLFRCAPGDYSLIGPFELGDLEPGEELQTGPWNLTWEVWSEEKEQWVEWTCVINLDIDETTGTGTITFTQTSEQYDKELQYVATVTFPSALLGPEDEEEPPLELEADLEIDIEIEDSFLQYSTLKGTVQLLLSETANTAHLNGDIHFQFESGDFIKFNGELSAQLAENVWGHLTGTLETEDFMVTGDIRVDCVANPNMPEEYGGAFPANISIDGEIRTKDQDPVILDGALLLEIGNAATVNPNFEEEEYSENNWLNGKVTFYGLIQGSKEHGIEGVLILEETAFNEYELELTYTLNDNGVFRELTVWAANNNEENSLKVEITSTWGPARIEAVATFGEGFRNPPTSVTGKVEVDGIEVGTISFEQGIRIDYWDGSFETF